MKRDFLRYPLVALLALLGFAWASATSVTFTAGVDKTGGTTASNNLSIEKDGVTITISYGIMGNNDAYRLYSSGTLTIASTVGAIDRVEITQSSTNYPVSRLSISAGGGTYSNGVWTAEDNSTTNVELASSGQVRMSKIEVFLYDPTRGKVYMDDVTMNAGQTAPVLFKMNETSSVSAVQFTIALPEGFTPETNAAGRPVMTLASARQGTDHTVSGTIEGNNVKVMVYSPTAAELPTVNGGDLFTMNLTAGASLSGDYEVTVSDVLASSNSLGQVTLQGDAGTITVSPSGVMAQSISLNKSTLELAFNGTDQLIATVLPAEASQAVTWSSDEPGFVSVDENGNVFGVDMGSATITATTTDGSNLSASCVVSVAPPLAYDIELNMYERTMVLGDDSERVYLYAMVAPSGASQNPTWTNSDPSVAVRDESGLITAVGIGTTTFTATTDDGTNLSASCVITVTAPVATGIELNKTEMDLLIGQGEQLVATVSPEIASQEVTWSSSDESVATVDENGNVFGVGVGSAAITATTTNTADGSELSASCTVNVTAPLAENIYLNTSELRLTIYTSDQLSATVEPAGAVQEVAWSSADENVATVDQFGSVSAVGLGVTTITATTVDGTNLSASCEVTVIAPPATGITLNKSELELMVSATEQLIATVDPELASQEVTWSSSDESIATVDQEGNVTAVAVGTATITATTTDDTQLSASCEVTVVSGDIPVRELGFALEVPINRPLTLDITALPADATNPALEWSTADEEIAVVEDGKIKGLAVGTTTVTVTTTDGSDISLSFTVNVVEGTLNSADVNNDGVVNTGDVSAVYRAILNGEGN